MLRSPSMVKHFNYINREENYKKMNDLIYSESGNLPNWAKNGKEYWETTKSQEEQVEMEFQEGKRGEKNCSVRKYRFALPNEMTDEEMINFTKEYLRRSAKSIDDFIELSTVINADEIQEKDMIDIGVSKELFQMGKKIRK